MSVPPSSPGSSGTGQGPVRRRRPWWLAALVIPALAGAFLPIWVFWPVPVPPLRIARDTTYLTGPLNPDGTVNYVAAVNAMYSEGVTPANNAAILALRAVGPGAIGPDRLPEAVRLRVFELLGMEPLPVDGPYLIGMAEFEKAQATGVTDARARQAVSEKVHSRILKGLREGWKSEDEQLLKDWLHVNQRALLLLAEASRRERFFVPLVSLSSPPQIVGSTYLFGSPLCDGVRLYVCRAMLHVRTGELAGAMEDSLVGHLLTRLYVEQPQLLVSMLGIRIDRELSKVDAAIATDPRLSPELARELLRQLQSLQEFPSPHKIVDVLQRCEALDMVMHCVRHGVDPFAATGGRGNRRARVDWNVMLGRMNQWYDNLVESWQIPDYAERQCGIDQASDELRHMDSRAQSHESLVGILGNLFRTPQARQRKASILAGERLLAFATPTLSGIEQVRVEAIVHHRLAVVALALTLYHSENRTYPVSLDNLSPAYLATIPQDLFTDQALRYVPGDGGYLLYSMGPNGQDDGGKPKTDEVGDDADDIVIRVGAAAQPEADSQQPEEARAAP